MECWISIDGFARRFRQLDGRRRELLCNTLRQCNPALENVASIQGLSELFSTLGKEYDVGFVNPFDCFDTWTNTAASFGAARQRLLDLPRDAQSLHAKNEGTDINDVYGVNMLIESMGPSLVFPEGRSDRS